MRLPPSPPFWFRVALAGLGAVLTFVLIGPLLLAESNETMTLGGLLLLVGMTFAGAMAGTYVVDLIRSR